MADPETQIRAILEGRAYDLATAELGVSHMARRSYSEVFTVSRADVEEYVRTHGYPRKRWCSQSGAHLCEGLHFYKADGEWHLSWHDRGTEHDRRTFVNALEAEKALLDTVISISLVPLRE